ncbi:GntR family transcriptional regulator [Phyllobacterium myrsinacearum]|uniref:DNA-binding GntR family transcriptional regulator n=1 Tax=Phyllobacterium myrsinacearum TaxID=28101 RepID=A0A839EL78_9HYPH|nr:DNA-binding GntR family transcriptional regulator [Phyllobacterium myrsinacearum]
MSDDTKPSDKDVPLGGLASIPFGQLEYDRPTASQIYPVLKNAILKMDLEPGRLISETEVGARFGASRTPVREAFAQLRDADLITTRPSRGTFVTKLNLKRFLEAHFIREAIEIANVTKLCDVGLAPEFEQQLSELIVRQQAMVDQNTDLAFQALDDQFHLTLARATGFERVAGLLEREKMPLDRLRVLSLRSTDHQLVLIEEHKQMLDTIIRRDISAAIEATRVHLASVLNALSSLAKKHADYFDE